MDIAAWLRELGLERYQQAFLDNDVDVGLLLDLAEGDLEKLGVASLGHRKTLLRAIEALRAPGDELAAGATAIADEALLAQPPPASPPEAERRQLTVMFVDLVGSTELSAKLDPEDMSAVIRAYQDAAAGKITRFEGHIAKFMGDGVLAYFGYPRAHEDDAERAVRAGLALVQAVAGLEAAGQLLAARIGIATGLVVVGELVGEGEAQERAVIGETPNLAARLQALADPGGVIISQATRRLVGGRFELADLGPRRLKGFAEPVAAFRVEGEGRAEGRFEALHGERLTPLVGREHELAMLMQLWAWAKEGDGQVVLIAGEAGIGKSRLLRALRGQLAGEPHLVLSHFCSPYHTNSALHPIITQLERTAGFASHDEAGDRLAKLEALLARSTEQPDEAVPLIGALLGVPTDDRYPALNLSPQRQKQRTLEVLVEQLTCLTRERPVLVLYEDVHWVDPSTLELLDLLVERVRALPVLVVLTYRPGFTPPWTGQSHVTALTMKRLGRHQRAALVEGVTGARSLPAEVLDQIVARTDGVPLFIEELTKTVLESGLLIESGDRYELSGPLPSLAIPATLHDSLMARLDRLGPVKELAQIGAVIGREFSHELLAAVAPMSANLLGGALEQLVNSELVFRRGAGPEAIYSFKHALVQDAAYQSLLKSTRQPLHAQIADVLETRFPEVGETQPELLAHHFSDAGYAESAVRYWVRAAQRATNRSANREVIDHVRTGLKSLRTLPERIERDRQEFDLQIALAVAYAALKGFNSTETRLAFIRAQQISEQIGDDLTRLITALRGIYNCHFAAGEHARARTVAARMLTAAKRTRDASHLVQAYTTVGAGLFYRGKLLTSRRSLEKALSLYNHEQPYEQTTYVLNPKTAALMNLSWLLWTLGYPDQAMQAGKEVIDFTRSLSQPFSLTVALVWVGSMLTCCGQVAKSESLIHELQDVIADHGIANLGHRATLLQGKLLMSKGQVETGVALIGQALDESRAAGARLAWTWMASEAALEYIFAGMKEESCKLLTEAFEFMDENDECNWAAELYRLEGELSLPQQAGGESGAEAHFRRAVEVARSQRAKSLELRAATSLARLWANRGEPQKAHDLLAPVYDWFTEGFDTADLKGAKALLDELR